MEESTGSRGGRLELHRRRAVARYDLSLPDDVGAFSTLEGSPPVGIKVAEEEEIVVVNPAPSRSFVVGSGDVLRCRRACILNAKE